MEEEVGSAATYDSSVNFGKRKDSGCDCGQMWMMDRPDEKDEGREEGNRRRETKELLLNDQSRPL